ncbi:MAG: IS1595 family transposase [Terriglobia bacterium]
MSNLNAPHFQDADKARRYLERLRWPHGPICPHCGSECDHYQLKGKSTRPGLWKCRDCRKQFSVTVGTVFERSKIPLHVWLQATFLLCSSKKGMSSHQLHRMLGVTYKTAWFMTHRIREAMTIKPTGLLGSGGGTVEADETYWGNAPGKTKRRGYEHKMKIVALVERDGDVRSFHVQHVSGKTLRPILKAQIAPEAHLMTDEFGGYCRLGREFASHGVVNHSAGVYADGDITTNTIESVFSLLKRGLIGTFHHVSEEHLQRYLHEFDFRYNRRKIDDIERTDEALVNIVGKRLTYRRPAEASL